MARHDLTVERLRELLHYNPDTGLFTYRVKRGTGSAGKIAGSKKPAGYVEIKIDYQLHKAHRLAWFYVHGTWPLNEIDHIDGDTYNNALHNLREATHAQNMKNSRMYKSNRSGFAGVFPNYKRWTAKIQVDGKPINLGSYATPELAHEAYLVAKRKLHPFCTI